MEFTKEYKAEYVDHKLVFTAPTVSQYVLEHTINTLVMSGYNIRDIFHLGDNPMDKCHMYQIVAFKYEEVK